MSLRAVLRTVFSVPHTPLPMSSTMSLDELVEKDIAASDALILVSKASHRRFDPMAEVIDGLLKR